MNFLESYLPVLLFVARKVAGFFIPRMHNSEDSQTILILVIILVAVTSILGLTLTEKFAKRLCKNDEC
jgi:hypothetical protein